MSFHRKCLVVACLHCTGRATCAVEPTTSLASAVYDASNIAGKRNDRSPLGSRRSVSGTQSGKAAGSLSRAFCDQDSFFDGAQRVRCRARSGCRSRFVCASRQRVAAPSGSASRQLLVQERRKREEDRPHSEGRARRSCRAAIRESRIASA